MCKSIPGLVALLPFPPCCVDKSMFMGHFFLYFQVSEAGIHRPHVSGIHGRDSDGAYSIVLAGGYEDDLVSYSQRPSQKSL